MKLKDEFKYRVVVEESLSIGVLGATGRGISEHFGIPVSARLLWAARNPRLAAWWATRRSTWASTRGY